MFTGRPQNPAYPAAALSFEVTRFSGLGLCVRVFDTVRSYSVQSVGYSAVSCEFSVVLDVLLRACPCTSTLSIQSFTNSRRHDLTRTSMLASMPWHDVHSPVNFEPVITMKVAKLKKSRGRPVTFCLFAFFVSQHNASSLPLSSASRKKYIVNRASPSFPIGCCQAFLS